jgi:plastocyanin domain-containing protein
MNKTSLISITIILLAIFGFVFILGFNADNTGNSVSAENSEIRNGVQYITIDAGGGYSPRLSSAKAGIPTKLIIKTNGVYDCSSALVIRSLNFQKILPQTGETVIDVGTPQAGVPLQGICGMGMYNFSVDFN